MKKKKRIVILTMLLTGCILAGCAQNADSHIKENADNNLASMSQEEPYATAIPVTVQSETTLSDIADITDAVQINTQFFNGEEVELWYGNDNRMIAMKHTTLYLYDVITGKVVSETETEMKENVSIYPYDNGYCVIGSSVDSASGKETMLCIFYDEILEETNRISLDEMVEDVIFTEFAVSADGSKLAYCDFWKGLNVYDLKTGTTKQLINMGADTSHKDRKNILTIDALYFEQGGKGLVFSAQTDKSNVTYESWGRINLDGSELENHILDKGLGNAIAYKKERLIFGEDSLTFCSAMGYVNVKEKTQDYSKDIPSGSAAGGPKISQNGESFGVTQLQDKCVQISIYRTADFSLIYQETIADDNEEYFYRIPEVYLFDELKVGIICMGGHNDIPLKTVLIDFGK